MALTLDPALAAAMDSQSRHPLMEITSSSLAEEIPFDGSYLSTGVVTGQYNASITNSTGRLCVVYSYGGNIRYHYSDTDRTVFSTVDIALASGETINDISLCELADGNIGLVYFSTDSLNRCLKHRIITVDGEAVSDGTIETLASITTWCTGPYVLTLANDTYLMVYGKYIAGDGHYHLYKYTSSDFETWTGPAELSIYGMTDTLKKGNPSLLQISTNDIWLWFDYVEVETGGAERTNIYYSVSTGNGVSWSAAVGITAYDDYTAVGVHPVAIQKAPDMMTLIFNEKRAALSMDKYSPGWFEGKESSLSGVGNLQFDAVHRKLYVTPARNWIGADYIPGVLRIDIDTWKIDRSWDEASTPALPVQYTNLSYSVRPYRYRGSGQYVVLALADHLFVLTVLDGENEEVRNFYFADNATLGWAQNVVWDSAGIATYGDIVGAWFDETSSPMRLYVLLANGPKILVGYIEYGQAAVSYTLKTVVSYTYPSAYESTGLGSEPLPLSIYPEEDIIMLSSTYGNGSGYFYGSTRLFLISSGVQYKGYVYPDYADYPRGGIVMPVIIDGKIYGGINHLDTYGQDDLRGMCIIDMSTDIITYARPSWGSYDDYYLCWFMEISDNRILCASNQYGITIYDILNETWELISNDTMYGLTASGENAFHALQYDETNGYIMAAHGYEVYTVWPGLLLISEYGSLNRACYYNAGYTTTWAWTDQGYMTTGFIDYDMSVCLDPVDRSIYAFWTCRDANGLSIKWDKDGGSFDLSPYIVNGDDITIRRVVESTPSSLTFTVSNGHLFDIYNNLSLLSPYLKKGSKLTVRFGERVSGTDYWQNMGEFLVTEQSVSYERGRYPVMEIKAEDKSVLWDQMDVVATQAYEDAYPERIIEDILKDNTDLETADFDMPVFVNRSKLYYQWLDTELRTAVDEIAERFGYYLRLDVNGKVTARYISDGNDIDHVYTDTTKIINLTPEDQYSDFTNRVIVTGQERDEITVIYPEERVGSLNGTVTYNTGEETFTIWYSDDRSRTCRNPRLQVIQTTTSVGFALAGGLGESLIDDSPANPDSNLRYKYCTVIVESTDLTTQLLTCLAMIIFWASILMFTTLLPKVAGVLKFILTVFIIEALQILAATGSYQYEIWAQPTGTVRRSIQGIAEDTAHQALIRQIVTKKIEDPLCYTVADCREVAEFQLMVAELQRKRVKFEKLADLRDEDGDTIQIRHPLTNESLTVFITALERAMKPGEDGYFIDKIEGWVI